MAISKSILFLLLLFPFGHLIYEALSGLLGPDPGKELILETGEWALRILLMTLAITPLRQLLAKPRLVAYRRMLGLYAWFYASMHLAGVLTYMLGWNWDIFVEEFAERPYMALGIIAWCLMVPLGITSNRWAQRKLRSRWKTLHKLTYVVAIVACAHFVWLVRSDYGEALVYSLLVAVLLAYRVSWFHSIYRKFEAIYCQRTTS